MSCGWTAKLALPRVAAGGRQEVGQLQGTLRRSVQKIVLLPERGRCPPGGPLCPEGEHLLGQQRGNDSGQRSQQRGQVGSTEDKGDRDRW